MCLCSALIQEASYGQNTYTNHISLNIPQSKSTQNRPYAVPTGNSKALWPLLSRTPSTSAEENEGFLTTPRYAGHLHPAEGGTCSLLLSPLLPSLAKVILKTHIKISHGRMVKISGEVGKWSTDILPYTDCFLAPEFPSLVIYSFGSKMFSGKTVNLLGDVNISRT